MARKSKSELGKNEVTISHEEFDQFLRGLVLKDVSPVLLHAELQAGSNLGKAVELEFGERATLIRASKTEAIAQVGFAVRVVRPNSDEPLAQFQTVYQVTYLTEQTMTQQCFDQLRKVTLRIHTVPFAREWIRETSARLGLKPIVLPLSIAHPAAVPRQKAE